MKLSERLQGLVCDEKTGRVVGTKLASTTGHLLMSFFFCWHNFKEGFQMDLWLVYAGVVAGHKTAEKMVDLKWGRKDTTKGQTDE